MTRKDSYQLVLAWVQQPTSAVLTVFFVFEIVLSGTQALVSDALLHAPTNGCYHARRQEKHVDPFFHDYGRIRSSVYSSSVMVSGFNPSTKRSQKLSSMALFGTQPQGDDVIDRSISFVVTGFGPFQGVSDNPTSILVPHLAYHWTNHVAHLPYVSILQTLVLETSADSVKKELDALYSRASLFDTDSNLQEVVFFHLGVSSRLVQYHLERYAYNLATFLTPDEQGYLPREECICQDIPLGMRLETSLDVNALCYQINKGNQQPSTLAAVSTNPGTFVCNYAYCYSLNKCTIHNTGKLGVVDKSPRLHSLFVHVPPFSVAPQQQQMDFVTKTMRFISKQLLTAT